MSPDRRNDILQAALAAFLEDGYRATSLAAIRQRSGASTGSIYHFFAGKGGLAEALFDRSIHNWAIASGPAPANSNAPAADAIRASVGGLATWAMANPEEARFLDEIRSLATPGNELAVIAARLAEGQAAAAARFTVWQQRGEVRPLPWPLAHALMLGPTYDLIRRLPDPALAPDTPQVLAEAAWNAVRAP